MTITRIKISAIIILLTAFFAVLVSNETSVRVVAIVADDSAAVYKAKCAMCHSPKAEKLFDPAKADDELVQIVLKGKKGEKPPYMPGFETKGMTADEAKGLVSYMKSLRAPAN